MNVDTVLGGCFSLKSFMYDGASFCMQKSQGILLEEITGLKLWHVMIRFLRDEENVVVIFY